MKGLNIADAMIVAEEKAWKSLAGYKFLMFGYHAAQWVLLNSLDSPARCANPFRRLVALARQEGLSVLALYLDWSSRISPAGLSKLHSVCRYLAFEAGLFQLLNHPSVAYDSRSLQVAATRVEAKP